MCKIRLRHTSSVSQARHLLLKEKAFGWLHFLRNANRCIPPHPSRYSLDTFSRLGEGFYSYAVFMLVGRSIQQSQTDTNDQCIQSHPRGTPILIGAGWRSQTIGEIFKGTDGACADPDTRIFPATGRQCCFPVFIQLTFRSHTGSLVLS